MARCFVIQPFDKGGQYDKCYRDVLSPAIKDAGLDAYRVDKDLAATILIDDIENGIREADICLADFTENNPNIWYEVGFAMANGKRVVLVCAEPRPTPFPFDVRHRHIITYTLHSPSDFEELRKEVTNRLKAQVQKAEQLQTAVAIAQIKPTQGLTPHEVAVLLTIVAEVLTPQGGLSPYAIKESMKRSGYTPVASTIALAGLQKKEMIEFYEEYDENHDRQYTACKLTEAGVTWMLDNQDQFQMTARTTIKDEDIPF